MKREFRLRAAAAVAVVVTASALLTAPAFASLPAKPAQTWGTNGRVETILPVGDRVVVGGTFSAVVDKAGVSHPAQNLAVISVTTGAVDLSWQGGTNDTVTALTAVSGMVYVGGLFSRVNGATRTKLAALDLATGALDPTWTPATDGPVDAMAAVGGSVFAAGSFTNLTDGAGTHARPYVAKLDAATGVLDTAWTAAPDGRTRALVPSVDGSQLFLGGDFDKVNGVSNRSTAAVSTDAPGSLGAFKGTATNGTNFAPVMDLATDGAQLYVAAGGAGGACTAMDAATGARVWSKRGNGNMQAVRQLDGVVYCGGHFGTFDGLTRRRLAAVSATAPYATTSFSPKVNSALGVWSLGTDPTHLYLGGDFTTVAGATAKHYAMFVDSSAQTAPSAPTLSGRSDDSVVHLDWTPPASDGGSAILRYKVYRTTTGVYGGSYATVSSGTTFNDTGVTNGTAYTYKVTAVNAIGEGAASNEVTVTPDLIVQTPPAAPSGVVATGGSGSVQLSWSAPADTGNSPITGYRVYRGTASGEEAILASPPGTGTTYTDTAITAGTTYYYTVTADNAIGEGPPSSEVSATPTAGVPSAPTLTASVVGSVVHLSWTVPASDGGSPITKYRIVRDGIGWTVPATTTAYDDAAATSGSHVYQVRAINAVGSGPFSNKVTVDVP